MLYKYILHKYNLCFPWEWPRCSTAVTRITNMSCMAMQHPRVLCAWIGHGHLIVPSACYVWVKSKSQKWCKSRFVNRVEKEILIDLNSRLCVNLTSTSRRR